VSRTGRGTIDSRRKLSTVEPLPGASAAVDAVYRFDWGRIVATLIRVVGDFDVAEEQIVEALPLVEEALRGGGPYAPQAAIAAVHCRAARPGDTVWSQIVLLYDRLERLEPSPVVSLNRAAAVAMVDGPRAALALVDGLAADGELERYHLLHAARADLLRRLGSVKEAAKSYAQALALVTNDAERRFLERRLREVSPAGVTPEATRNGRS
jgi:predicted RNA polymerase sigma factor